MEHLGNIRETLDDKLAVINAQDGVYPDLSGMRGDICWRISNIILRIQLLNSQARKGIKKVDMIILVRGIMIRGLEDGEEWNRFWSIIFHIHLTHMHF